MNIGLCSVVESIIGDISGVVVLTTVDSGVLDCCVGWFCFCLHPNKNKTIRITL